MATSLKTKRKCIFLRFLVVKWFEDSIIARQGQILNLTPGVNSTKLFSLLNGHNFPFIAINHGYFIVNKLYPCITKWKGLEKKSENEE